MATLRLPVASSPDTNTCHTARITRPPCHASHRLTRPRVSLRCRLPFVSLFVSHAKQLRPAAFNVFLPSKSWGCNACGKTEIAPLSLLLTLQPAPRSDVLHVLLVLVTAKRQSALALQQSSHRRSRGQSQHTWTQAERQASVSSAETESCSIGQRSCLCGILMFGCSVVRSLTDRLYAKEITSISRRAGAE